MSAFRILARVLVFSGSSYVDKFSEQTQGFSVLQMQLAKYWRIPSLWNMCLSILLGIDIADLKSEELHDPNHFLSNVLKSTSLRMNCVHVIPVILFMFEEGFRYVTQLPNDRGKPDETQSNDTASLQTISAIPRLLGLIHEKSDAFREYCYSSNTVRELLNVLFNAMTNRSSSIISPTTLSSDLQVLDEKVSSNTEIKPSYRFSDFDLKHLAAQASKQEQICFKLIDRHRGISNSSIRDILRPLGNESPAYEKQSLPVSAEAVSFQVTNFLMRLFLDQIISERDFSGLGLFLKTPPASLEDRATLSTYLLRELTLRLYGHIASDTSTLRDLKTLQNLLRFMSQAFEAIQEGWWKGGSPFLLTLMHGVLKGCETIHEDNFRSHESIRSSIRHMQRRLTISTLVTFQTELRFQQDEESLNISYASRSFLFHKEDNDAQLMKLLCLVFYAILRDSSQPQNALAVLSLLECAASQRPQQFSSIFSSENKMYSYAERIAKLSTIQIDSQQSKLAISASDLALTSKPSLEKAMIQWIGKENGETNKSLGVRQRRRQERIEKWHLERLALVHRWTEHELAAKNWIENIQTSEATKFQRSRQDQQEAYDLLEAQMSKICRELKTLGLREQGDFLQKWQLDDVEARDRMRMRLFPTLSRREKVYETRRGRSLRASTTHSLNQSSTSDKQSPASNAERSKAKEQSLANAFAGSASLGGNSAVSPEEFEIVSPPAQSDFISEDKNRKVMRSLQRGEHVLDVCNVSRIVGLEAFEGLVVIGKKCLYLFNDLFNCTDGEIIDVRKAPLHERDPFTRIISGSEVDSQGDSSQELEYSTNHWTWAEILSFSKRQFLFRDVALEVFFTDGRSFLFTTVNKSIRDSLYASIIAQQKNSSNGGIEDDISTARKLVYQTDERGRSGTVGSRLTNVFSSMLVNPTTKRWIRGEMSNFQYLMQINTMAGRSFNDLTQYPVFPWVLADYTSAELDLTNPRSFRDLSKPMGCQSSDREAAIRERYASFAEMDESTPAFHYGTHYSSAMIVTSYLIRLEPFARSSVLLQGGNFDHANRIFQSIEKAWFSASRDTISDVRELIPEFFYLPEFLVNVNEYDFGVHEATGAKVNDVVLPPWAKGDPQIFIAKHREALESHYVSQNLHNWIDLIFGVKQRGEAALESVNVFHHLSYEGAKDLDTISDAREKTATIGIIHNFGQTPKQVFTRLHEPRESGPTVDDDAFGSIHSYAKMSTPIHGM